MYPHYVYPQGSAVESGAGCARSTLLRMRVRVNQDTSEEVNISLQRRGLNTPPKFFFLTYLLLIHRPSYMCRSCRAF